jgi:hypothetical protein
VKAERKRAASRGDEPPRTIKFVPSSDGPMMPTIAPSDVEVSFEDLGRRLVSQ